MKLIIKAAALSLAVITLGSFLLSCKNDQAEGDGTETDGYISMPEYDVDNIGSYIKPFEYTELTVYAEFGETRQEALWKNIVESADITVYPEAQVEYYVAQERAKYRYYAKRDGIEYEALLEALGVTESSMTERAKALVKGDLVLEYIIKDAKITLSEEEKRTHADKYATKLTEVYGYDKDYIKSNMKEQMYDAMLSDKAMEFLLLNNTVYTTTSK